jgi:hypothetical protein
VAIVVDQTATGQSVGSGSSLVITWPTLPAAGSTALIAVSVDSGSGGVTSAVDNGTAPSTFTADVAIAPGAHSGKYIFRANGISLPGSGSYHVTLTFSGTTSFAISSGRTYTGVAPGAPASAPGANLGTSNSVTTLNVTPAVTGSLLFGSFNDGSSANPETITLTTSGATSIYANQNGSVVLAGAVADNIATTTASQNLAWSLSDAPSWGAFIALYAPAPAPPSAPTFLIAPGWLAPSKLSRRQPPPPSPPGALVPATTGLTGSGSLSASGTLIVPGAAALDGTGSLAATGAISGAQLTGSGSLRAYEEVQYAALDGQGSLRAYEKEQFAALDGSGTLGLDLTLKLTVGMSGTGSLSVPHVAGGLVNAVSGAATPQAFPGSSQVAVAAPGSSNWQWLGTLGHVTALTYSFACPGGCDKMSCTVMVPAAYRTQLFNPGSSVKVTRGGHVVWDGKLDEPQPTASGWTLTAVGTGNRGQDFLALYSSTWPASQPDQSINNAITRGLPWTNPGVGSPSGIWLGQAVDSGAQTITALLNLLCTRGGLTWYVNSQPGGPYNSADLAVFALPSAVNRLLVCTTPVPRTLGGDINTIVIRYQVSADNTTTNAAAVHTTTTVQNAQSVAAHGVMETFIDLSDVGVQSAAAAQAVGNLVLSIYQRASFAGPFTVRYGELLNPGGAAIDPGTDQAGTVCRLILTDYGYGGEVTPQFPITFITGGYEWDDFAQTATVTPYQSVNQSLTGLLSLENTVLKPIAAAGP